MRGRRRRGRDTWEAGSGDDRDLGPRVDGAEEPAHLGLSFQLLALLKNQKKQKHHADSTLSHTPCHSRRKLDTQTASLEEGEFSARRERGAFNRAEARPPLG